MIFGYSLLYDADQTEIALPDAAAARRLLTERRPDIIARMEQRIRSISRADRHAYLDATLLGTARLGLRHGSLGEDFHHYHNEDHVMDLADRRLDKMLEVLNPSTMPEDDWLSLLLFAACHDLRQRESRNAAGPVGGNEAASVAETFRILDVCGFDQETHRSLYIALELMIAGSTFDPRLAEKNPDTVNLTGGALARSLGLWLDSIRPLWREDVDMRRGERLARLSADLDTANVGEHFPLLGKSALQLCEEQLLRRGLSLEKPQSTAFAQDFLTQGQMHYFFDLHRFCSREGEHVFGQQKRENAAKVRLAAAQLGAVLATQAPKNADEVMKAYQQICNAL